VRRRRAPSAANSRRTTIGCRRAVWGAARRHTKGRRIGDMRFETDSAWKRNGSGIDQLAKELRLALQYPEGASF
jgi:hypothetical protein